MQIRITWGATRFVILTDRYAIKFSRPPRIIWALWRTFVHARNGVFKEKFHAHGRTGFGLIFKFLATNMAEDEVWRMTRRPELVPTLWSFFGIVNVQPRGAPVTEAELDWEHPFGYLRAEELARYDLLQPKNFVRLAGQIMVSDYGHPELRNFLLPRYALAA